MQSGANVAGARREQTVSLINRVEKRAEWALRCATVLTVNHQNAQLIRDLSGFDGVWYEIETRHVPNFSFILRQQSKMMLLK